MMTITQLKDKKVLHYSFIMKRPPGLAGQGKLPPSHEAISPLFALRGRSIDLRRMERLRSKNVYYNENQVRNIFSYHKKSFIPA